MNADLSALAGRRVLVTGGTGFLGSHLTSALDEAGADVTVLASGTRRGPVPERVGLRHADITDREGLGAVVRSIRPDLVFHLAAYTHAGRSWSDAPDCVRVNVEGTVNLLESLDGLGYHRLVHTSTSDVYGDAPAPFTEATAPRPRSPYGISKRAAEMFCDLGHQTFGWPVVQLRVGTTYGPGQSLGRLVPDVISHGLRGVDLAMTSGTQTREFNYVLDIVHGLLLAAVTDGVEGEILNLGNGSEVAIAEVARLVTDLMGRPMELRIGALPDRPAEPRRSFVDASRARSVLGWSPSTELTEGLKKTISWFSAQRDTDGGQRAR